jgi:MFS family permease
MTGALSSSFAVGQILGANMSARLADWLGRRILIVGCGVFAVGVASLITLVHVAGPNPSAWDVVIPLLVAGLGSGITIAPNVASTLADVTPADNGAASGVLNTGQRIGSALGIAIVATVLFGTLKPSGPSHEAIASAFSHSFQLAMLADLGLVLIAMLLVLAMPQKTQATTLSPLRRQD